MAGPELFLTTELDCNKRNFVACGKSFFLMISKFSTSQNYKIFVITFFVSVLKFYESFNLLLCVWYQIQGEKSEKGRSQIGGGSTHMKRLSLCSGREATPFFSKKKFVFAFFC
jgi:hypothetical protein